MRIASLPLVLSLALGSAVPALAARHNSRRTPTVRHASSSSNSKKSAKVVHTTFRPGQRGIDNDRATEIQEALIKAGYLNGEPTGHWDAATEEAVQTLQRDNGWQTKLVPDSRAIIKLGLGPKRETGEAPTAVTPAVATPAVADNTVQTTGSK